MMNIRDTLDVVKQSAALCLLKLFKTDPSIIPSGEILSSFQHVWYNIQKAGFKCFQTSFKACNFGFWVFSCICIEMLEIACLASGWCPVQLVTPCALSMTRFLLKSDLHKTSVRCTCQYFR